MWNFWIDVGGTFTDCLAVAPDGQEHFTKVLSSARTKGVAAAWVDSNRFRDPDQVGPIQDFWQGSNIDFIAADGKLIGTSRVTAFHPDSGEFELEDCNSNFATSVAYELYCDRLAPILAMHLIQRVPLFEELSPCCVDLGTTRGTNALLTKTGARAALVATRGFGDFLRIGDQTRPNLFQLSIQKPQPLFEMAIEVNERILADGTVRQPIDRKILKKQLQELQELGIESIAICFMFGFRYPEHEEAAAEIATDLGFSSVQTSSKTAPLIKLVPRGETTVLDAYLNPVIGSYLDQIQDQLPQGSQTRFMTSGGGLTTRSRFSGKDSVLSGPAGGVVGAARVAEQLGIDRVIGFDMGGTSTDVSRYEGTFERTFETRKADVRIMMPMLAVETVAAGGGSICWFDGTRLQVGPESAGSDPGPACYGRGGPLSVTDINLFLGRIQQAWFPFRLDQEIVGRKLKELCVRLKEAGHELTPDEVADGFLRIANHNMANAIRTVSVSKGYDPAKYALMSFGGAGSQHCCAVAQQLGMTQIIDHPQSSILSAVGIRLADQSVHAVDSYSGPLDADQLAANLESGFGDLRKQVEETLARDGFGNRHLDFQRSLDLRYFGTESSLTILEPDDGNFRKAFEDSHRRQFGYLQDQEVEITAVRVDGFVRGNRLSLIDRPDRYSSVHPTATQSVLSEGRWQNAGIFQRDQLVAGDRVEGPALVIHPHGTTIIDPNWHALVFEYGVMLIQKTESDSESNTTKSEIQKSGSPDPIQLEIFNSHFASIAEQMGHVLQKTSISVNVKERLDFSCAVFTQTGDLVVNAPHIPVHLGAMSETVRSIIENNPEVHAGDVFVTNDPYAGGSHLPDVTVVTPVFDASGRELWFWVASRSHHAEMGGMAPGSMPANATCLGEEGVLISNFRLIEGTPAIERTRTESPNSVVEHFDELKELLVKAPYPSRSPTENLADIRAQVAANQNGLNQLMELVNHNSFETVNAFMKHIQDAAEYKARQALMRLPDGRFEFSDQMDNGKQINVSIEKSADTMIVDFEGTDPVGQDNLNANRAIVTAAIMYVMRCLIDEEIPLNEGVMKPVELKLPECFLNPKPASDPYDSPAIVGGNVETSQRIVDVLLGALNVAAASQGTMNNWLMGDEHFGYYETLGGGAGATKQVAGADAVHSHMTNTRLTDPEILESRYPVIMKKFAVRDSSGGAGAQPGGNGLIREIEFQKPCVISLLTSRRNSRPYGQAGGGDGDPGRNLLIRSFDDAGDYETTELPSRCETVVKPGDRLRMETPGGGGWGAANTNSSTP